MSPEFAGTNALYSVEFYRRMERVLKPGAIVAQWVPFHIVPPAAAADAQEHEDHTAHEPDAAPVGAVLAAAFLAAAASRGEGPPPPTGPS